MAKSTQRTRKFQQVTRTVVASLDQQGPGVAARAAQAHPELTAAFMASSFQAMGKLLTRAAGELAVAEQAYQAEQADDGPARARRDRAIEAAATTLLRVRGALEKALGKKALSGYGLDGETVREGNVLLARTRNAVQLLQARPVKVADDFGGTFDSDKAVQLLAPLVQELAEALDGVAAEARKLQQALDTRNRSAAAWDEAYAGVTQVTMGLYRLAGARDLADRLRPKAPKAAGEVALAAASQVAPLLLESAE